MSTTGIPRHLTTARVRAAKLEALGAAAVEWANATRAFGPHEQPTPRQMLAIVHATADLQRAALEYADAQPESEGDSTP